MYGWGSDNDTNFLCNHIPDGVIDYKYHYRLTSTTQHFAKIF